MKNKNFILCLLLFFCQYAVAQNVGIGITSPAALFHLKGNSDTSQLVIDAANTQSNSRPLIRLRSSDGNDLLWIHSDDTSNIFIGRNAGTANNVASGGKDNIFIGTGAGSNNSSGNANIGVGVNVLLNNSTGTYNTAMGWHALRANTTGTANSAFGQALEYNTTGSYNTGIGHGALFQNTTANYNTAAGGFALLNNTTGLSNTAIGMEAMRNNTTGSQNTAIGVHALYSVNNHYNTAIGYDALFSNTSYNNTAVGHKSSFSNSTGNNNTSLGVNSLTSNTVGSINVAIGSAALRSNTTGILNTATGASSLGDNTTGGYNVANGYLALTGNTTGTRNVGIGYWTLSQNGSANYNTAVGDEAGRGHIHGWNNTFIGASSNAAGAGFFNCIAIGSTAATTASNQVRIGNSSNNSIGGFANWTNISDGRFKKNIREDVKGLGFIMQLRPVTYQLDITGLRKKLNEQDEQLKESKMDMAIAEKESMIQTGFVAQEVEAVAKKLGYEFSGVDKPKNANDFYGLRYAEFVVPLVKAVQEQQKTIEMLTKKLERLEAELRLTKTNQ